MFILAGGVNINCFLLVPVWAILVYVSVCYVRFDYKINDYNRMKNLHYHKLLNPPARQANVDFIFLNDSHKNSVEINQRKIGLKLMVEKEQQKYNKQDIPLKNKDSFNKEQIQSMLESNAKKFNEDRVNCSAIIAGDAVETKRAYEFSHKYLFPNETEKVKIEERQLDDHLKVFAYVIL